MASVHLARIADDWSYGALVRLLNRDPSVLGAERLGVKLGRLEIGHPVECAIERPLVSPSPPAWTAELRLQAVGSKLFPRLDVDLQVRPVNAGVELAMEGRYIPPAGPFGWLLDTLFLRWVAQASLENYLDDIGKRIRSQVFAVDALTGIPI